MPTSVITKPHKNIDYRQYQTTEGARITHVSTGKENDHDKSVNRTPPEENG